MRGILLILLGVGMVLPRISWADSTTEAMNEAIQDEYRAYETYQNVISDFGQVRPFVNIVKAESRHIKELTALYHVRGLEAPKSHWNKENVPSYQSVESACLAAVQGELNNIAIYDRLMKLVLPQDVRETFSYLRRASLENHLPAFQRCAG